MSRIEEWEIRDPFKAFMETLVLSPQRNADRVVEVTQNLMDAINEAHRLVMIEDQHHAIATARARIQEAEERIVELQTVPS